VEKGLEVIKGAEGETLIDILLQNTMENAGLAQYQGVSNSTRDRIT